MTATPRVALDASVLAEILTGRDAERLRHSTRLVRAGERGDLRLVLPATALADLGERLAEPTGEGEGEGESDQRERSARIDAWLSGSTFGIVEVDERAGRRAAELALRHRLPGASACLLATAQLWGAKTVYTWDEALLESGARCGVVDVATPTTLPLPEELPLDG